MSKLGWLVSDRDYENKGICAGTYYAWSVYFFQSTWCSTMLAFDQLSLKLIDCGRLQYFYRLLSLLFDHIGALIGPHSPLLGRLFLIKNRIGYSARSEILLNPFTHPLIMKHYSITSVSERCLVLEILERITMVIYYGSHRVVWWRCRRALRHPSGTHVEMRTSGRFLYARRTL